LPMSCYFQQKKAKRMNCNITYGCVVNFTTTNVTVLQFSANCLAIRLSVSVQRSPSPSHPLSVRFSIEFSPSRPWWVVPIELQLRTWLDDSHASPSACAFSDPGESLSSLIYFSWSLSWNMSLTNH
jgi:hypothetical protein